MNNIILFFRAILPVTQKPEYDRIAIILNSPSGRLFLAATYSLCFQLTHFPGKEYIPFLLIPFALSKKFQIHLLSLGSLLFLAVPSSLQPSQVGSLHVYFQIEDKKIIPAMIFTSGLIAILFAEIQSKILNKLRAHCSTKLIHFLPLIIFIFLVLSGSHFQPHGFWGFSLWSFILFYFFPCLSLSYSLTSPSNISTINSLKEASFKYKPLWNCNIWFPFLPISQTKDNYDKTRLMLKGIRLLLWALTLEQSSFLLNWTQKALSIPRLNAALHLIGRGATIETGQAWAIAIAHFFYILFYICIGGHIAVSLARVFGFDLFRHAYKPFSAVSISDFFQRFAYYYTSLLRNLFFYPIFFLISHLKLKIRLFFSILLSTVLANFFLCFFRDSHLIATMGFSNAFKYYSPYLIFCSFLGLFNLVDFSIASKENNSHQIQNNNVVSLFLFLLNKAGILLFYVFLFIFHDLYVGNINRNWQFFLRLWGF